MEPTLDNSVTLQSSGDLSTENSSTSFAPGSAANIDANTQPVGLNLSSLRPQSVQPEEDTVSELDATLSRVKVLLLVADHAVTDVWEDAVAFVKKAIKTEDEVADKLETVLLVAGHDVSDVLKDAFAFAKKY